MKKFAPRWDWLYFYVEHVKEQELMRLDNTYIPIVFFDWNEPDGNPNACFVLTTENECSLAGIVTEHNCMITASVPGSDDNAFFKIERGRLTNPGTIEDAWKEFVTDPTELLMYARQIGRMLVER